MVYFDRYKSVCDYSRYSLRKAIDVGGSHRRQLVHAFRQRTLVLVKALMLQKRVLFVLCSPTREHNPISNR